MLLNASGYPKYLVWSIKLYKFLSRLKYLGLAKTIKDALNPYNLDMHLFQLFRACYFLAYG